MKFACGALTFLYSGKSNVSAIHTFEPWEGERIGEMTSTITLRDGDGETDLEALHEGLPTGIAPAGNELAKLVDADWPSPSSATKPTK